MSAVEDLIESNVIDIMTQPWVIRDGTVVPSTDTVAMKNGAVRLDAAYLYTDLRDSTLIADRYEPEVAGRIIRAFLSAASRVIRRYDGEIRSFDGDRVMGVFIGGSKCTEAVNAALGISWVVENYVTPAIQVELERQGLQSWTVTHGTGVDVGEVLVVRGGVRDNSDLVSIGRAPNVAAKLSSLPYSEMSQIRITNSVYSMLKEKTRQSNNGEEMFVDRGYKIIGPHYLKVYSSSWRRSP